MSRRRLAVVSAVAAGALVLAAAIALIVLRATVWSPEAAVRSYVGLIEQGRLSEASELVEPPLLGDDGALLVDDALAPDQRLTLLDAQTIETGRSSLRSVQVGYTVDGERHSASLFVEQQPGALGLGGWRVITPLVRGLDFQSEDQQTVTVNGIEIPVDTAGGAYVVYPGIYEVEAADRTETVAIAAGTPAVSVQLDD